MELEQYLRIVKKWLWVVVLGAVLAGGVAYGVSLLLPPVYRASTTLLVRTTAGGEDYGTVVVNQYLAATYAELLAKRPYVEAAAANLGLPESSVDDILSRTEVWVVPNTSVIRLTVDDQDPRLAMGLANQLVSVFVQAQQAPREKREQSIFVIEPARLPPEPIAPRTLLNTLVATAGGAVLAGGVAFLIEYLDDTLRTPTDVTQTLSLPTLAAIPHSSRRRERDNTPVALSAPLSPVARACYEVGAGALYASPSDQDFPGTVLITSPARRGEKADLAANLGVVLARRGLNVLLVDADLDQPRLHRVFGLTNEAGLTTVLTGHHSLQECVVETDTPKLSLLPSGPPLVEPSALLDSQDVARVLEELAQSADLVLFDAPPVSAAAESIVLAAHVDGTILAVESRSTQRRAAAYALGRLNGVHAKVLGVVLTGDRGYDRGHRENGHRS